MPSFDRDASIDQRFDMWQRKLIRKATRGMGRIFETRMFGINLAEERDERDEAISRRQNETRWRMQKGKTPRPEIPSIPAISILITTNKETRIDRAYQASLEANEPESKALIRTRMDERKANDMKNWAVVHPKYLGHGEDPFDPSLTRPDGTPVWDIVVPNPDVPGISKEEAIEKCVDYIMGELVKFGALRVNPTPSELGEPFETGRQETVDNSEGGVVFTTDAIREAAKAVGARDPKTFAEVQAIDVEYGAKTSGLVAPGADQHPDHPSRQGQNHESVA
nr:Unknown Function [uncultured bacterium]